MKPKSSLLTLFFITLSSFVFSQKGMIQGYVIDDQSQSPLTGVTINLINSPAFDNSDDFGVFRLREISEGNRELIVSHIGYKTKLVVVNVAEKKTSVLKIKLERSNLDLSSVTVSSKKNLLLNTIAPVDIKLRPVNTSQDILRIVSGLLIAQHAGGGKAEQIFLRGYDIDHGTDINISVDGMPVNMVSHAHGQGYADLHFLIPETVEKVNFDKGPFFTNKGNLATAGFVELHTKDFLESNQIKLQAGEFNTQRLFGAFKLLNKESEKLRQQLYVASEYFKSNGYFESPQDFHRLNIMSKYNAIFNNSTQLTILASILDSKWDASGQIPERAVESGMIGKFGSIDNSEGGNTYRANISAKISKKWKNDWQKTDQLYFTKYHFNLYSNFTFFLNDPINGDEINQQETRNIYGYTGTLSKHYLLDNKNAHSEIGWGFRYDDIDDIKLDHVVKRQFLENVQSGDINEFNGFIYIDQRLELNRKFNINGAIRYDFFKFGYKNTLVDETSFNKQARGVISPKLNFTYTPGSKLRIFLNTGTGFHSNDTRVILDKQAKDILPRVLGADLGMIIKPAKNLILKSALWYLYSQQEFVYTGDEGIVEPGGETQRMGVDLSARYQVSNWLFADIDLNYAKPRTIGEPKGKNYVPLAPTLTSIGGLTIKTKNGFNASLRYRFIDDRPANEDNSVQAEGYFLLDAILSYTWKKFEFSASAENILNRYWKEAQFDTESRLQFENNPVSEIHYTPGTKRFFKTGIAFSF